MKPKKITSILTGIFFILNQLFVPASSWAAVGAGSLNEVNIPKSFKLELPTELGTIETISTGNGPTLIHIQEAHGNYEVQKNISKILRHLKVNYGIDLILLEGNAFKLQPQLIRFFPDDMKKTREITEKLAEGGIVSGPELFFLDEANVTAYGIENPEAYQKNGAAFVKVLRAREQSRAFLDDMELQIERLTSPYLNKDLRSFLKRTDNFEAHLIPFDQWLEEIKSNAAKYLGIDLENPWFQMEWPMLLRVFTLKKFESRLDMAQFQKERGIFLKAIRGIPSDLSQEIERLFSLPLNHHRLPDPETGLLFERMISSLPKDFDYKAYPNVNLFIGHLILQSELSTGGGKGGGLMEEMDCLTNQITGKLAKNDKEKTITSLFKQHRLLKRLFRLELTPEDYAVIASSAKQSLRPSILIKDLLALNAGNRVRNTDFKHLDEINTLFDAALEFYRGAKERDTQMLENVEKRLRETGRSKAVVITGGFHAGPFQNHFEANRYNYALITPKMTEIKGQEDYVQTMLRRSKDKSQAAPATYRPSEVATGDFIQSPNWDFLRRDVFPAFGDESIAKETRWYQQLLRGTLRSEMRSQTPKRSEGKIRKGFYPSYEAIAIHLPSNYGVPMAVADFLKSNAKRLEKLGDQNLFIIMANLANNPERALTTFEITEETLDWEIRSDTTVFVDKMIDPPDNALMEARWEYLGLSLADEEMHKNSGKSLKEFGIPSPRESSYAYLLTGIPFPHGFLPVSSPESSSFRGYFSSAFSFDDSKMTEQEVEAKWEKYIKEEIDSALIFFDAKGDKGRYRNALIQLLNRLLVKRAVMGYDEREWYARIAKQAGVALSNEALETTDQILRRLAFIDLQKEGGNFVDWLTVLSDESVVFSVKRSLADEIVQDAERKPKLVKSFNSPYRIHSIFDRDARWLDESKLKNWLAKQRTIEYIKFFQNNGLWSEDNSVLIRKLHPEVADKIVQNRSEVRASMPQDLEKLINDLSDPDDYVKMLALKKLTGIATLPSATIEKAEKILIGEELPGTFLAERAVTFLGEIGKSFPEMAAAVLTKYFDQKVKPAIQNKEYWITIWGNKAADNLLLAVRKMGILGLPILNRLAEINKTSAVLENIVGAYGDLASQIPNVNELLINLLGEGNEEDAIKPVVRELLRNNPAAEQRSFIVRDLLARNQLKTVLILLASMEIGAEEILPEVISALDEIKSMYHRDFELGLQVIGKIGKNSTQAVEFLTTLLRGDYYDRQSRDQKVIKALTSISVNRREIWNALNELYFEYLKKGDERELIIDAMARMNDIPDRSLGPKGVEVAAAYSVMLRRDQQKLDAKIKITNAFELAKAGPEDSVASAKEPAVETESRRKFPSQINTEFATQSPKIARFADQIAEEFYEIGILKGSPKELQAVIHAAVAFSRNQKVLSALDELSLEIPIIEQGDGTNPHREEAAGRLIVAWAVVKYDLESPTRMILDDYVQGVPGNKVVASLTEIGIPRLRAEAILTEIHTYAWDSYLDFPDGARFIDKFVLIRQIEDFLEKEGFDNKLIELIAKYLNQQRITRAEIQEYHEAIRDWDKPFWNQTYKKAWDDARFALDMSSSERIEDREVHQQISMVMADMRRFLKHRAIIHNTALELEDLLKEDPSPDLEMVKSYKTYLEELKDQLLFRDGRSLEETLDLKPTMSADSAVKVDAHYKTIIIRLSSAIDRVGRMIRSEIRSVGTLTLSKLAEHYSGYLVLEQMRRNDSALFESIVKNLAAKHRFADEKRGLEGLPSEVKAFFDSEAGKPIRALFESSVEQTGPSRMIRVNATSASELAVPMLRSILDRNFKLFVVVANEGAAQDLKIEARAYARNHLNLDLNEQRFQVVVQDDRGIVPTLSGLVVKGEQMAIVADGEKGDEISTAFDELNVRADSLRLIDNTNLTIAEEMVLSATLLDQRTYQMSQQVQFTSQHIEGPFANLLSQARALAAILQAA